VATIAIIHTRAEGTIVSGTARGDGSAAILKAAGFRWAPSLRAWIVAQSRDRAAKTWKIDQAAEGLRVAGFEVEVQIDETPRPFGEAEAEREARAEARAERYTDRAERADAAAATYSQAARDEAAFIPPGQPILIGHHSERGHRAALKRIDQRMRRSIEEDGKATHYERAAEAASRYTQHREALGTTLRRIERLEASQRQIDRYIAEGHAPEGSDYRTRLEANHAQNADELAYWRQVVAEQEAAGAKVWSRADFTKGDQVRDDMGRWHTVLRVNAKSLTVPTPYSWTETLPYDKVRGRRDREAR
jgi:hypothetical protein